MSDAKKTITVTLYKSPIGALKAHKATVRGLGLRRMHHQVTLEDTPMTRGMVNAVCHLVRIVSQQ